MIIFTRKKLFTNSFGPISDNENITVRNQRAC